MDGLLFTDGVAVGSHLEFRVQTVVIQPRLQSESVVQLVLQSQRPRDRHLVVACTQNLVLARFVGIVQGDAHDDAACLSTHGIRIICQIDSIVRPVVDPTWNDICRPFSWRILSPRVDMWLIDEWLVIAILFVELSCVCQL